MQKPNSLKHCVRSQITRLQLHKNHFVAQIMVYHYEYSTYNSQHKVLVDPLVFNMGALKNQNYGLCWSTQSNLLSLKEYSTNCVLCDV